jgi:hypothetical protein
MVCPRIDRMDKVAQIMNLIMTSFRIAQTVPVQAYATYSLIYTTVDETCGGGKY